MNVDFLIDNLINEIDKLKSYSILDKLPIHIYQNKKFNLKGLSGFKILLLCNPCNGFGDIVFAMKLRTYLKEWYNCDVKIASTRIDDFKKLGEKEENLYHLKGGKSDQCRRFRNLHFSKGDKEITAPVADLVFVAPLQMDYDANYSDVKALVPYSNPLNTYFFSEYNDTLKKDFDFNTGVGKDRCGMLFTDSGKTKKIKGLKNPYAVVYIARDVARSETCFLDFVEMVAKKYSNLKKLDIVVPPWIAEDILSESKFERKTNQKVEKYFQKVIVKTKDESVDLETRAKRFGGREGNVLTFRGDIFPLPYESIKNLYTYSLRDILVTGDQSITDVLSCCWKKKLPMYQIVPWKRDFSKELAKNLPQKFLKYIRTSCGSTKAIHYNPDFAKFIKRWDFRKLAKPKLDAIVAFTLDCKDNQRVEEIKDIFLKSRSIESIIQKLEDL